MECAFGEEKKKEQKCGQLGETGEQRVGHTMQFRQSDKHFPARATGT